MLVGGQPMPAKITVATPRMQKIVSQ